MYAMALPKAERGSVRRVISHVARHVVECGILCGPFCRVGGRLRAAACSLVGHRAVHLDGHVGQLERVGDELLVMVR